LKLWDKEGGLITTIDGHGKRVNDCCYSPDGKIILSASDDGSLRLWDAVAGTQVSSLEGHSAAISCATFSPQSSDLLSASQDGSIRVWNASIQQKTKVVADVEEKQVEEETTPSEDKEEKVPTPEAEEDDPTSWHNKNASNTCWINSVSFNSKGNKLFAAARDGDVNVWDLETGTRSFRLRGAHTKSVNGVAINCLDTLIVTVSDDCQVVLWNKDGILIEKMKDHTNSVRSVAFHPNEPDQFATASWDCTIKIWNKRGCQKTLKKHTDWCNSVNYSPDGKLLVSTSHDRSFILWDVITGNCLQQVQAFQNWALSASFSHDSNHLIASCYDGTVSVYQISENGNKCEKQYAKSLSKRVNACKFVLPSNKLFASVGNDNLLHLFHVNDGSQASKFHTVAPATALDVNKKGELAFADSLGNIYFQKIVEM